MGEGGRGGGEEVKGKGGGGGEEVGVCGNRGVEGWVRGGGLWMG